MTIIVITHTSNFQIAKIPRRRNTERGEIFLLVVRVIRIHIHIIVHCTEIITASSATSFHRVLGTRLGDILLEQTGDILGDFGCLEHALGAHAHLGGVAECLARDDDDNAHDGNVHQELHEGEALAGSFDCTPYGASLRMTQPSEVQVLVYHCLSHTVRSPFSIHTQNTVAHATTRGPPGSRPD